MYELMKMLIDAAEGFVEENTTTSLPMISLAMCQRAQRLLDLMRSDMLEGDVGAFNRHLVKLYAAIPRSTENARIAEYLKRKGFLEYSTEGLDERIRFEQDFADCIQGAVEAALGGVETKRTSEETRIDAMARRFGLSITDADEDDLMTIRRAMGDDKRKLIRAWKVSNKGSERRFRSYLERRSIEETKLLWHGSATSNFLSISTNGLSIAKAGYGMFGHGIYFAKDFDKSRGYCSVCNSRWRGGSDATAVLGLFEVATGRPLHLDGPRSDLRPGCGALREYDSVWAHKGMNLHRDEFIVYDNDASSMRYIVETK